MILISDRDIHNPDNRRIKAIDDGKDEITIIDPYLNTSKKGLKDTIIQQAFHNPSFPFMTVPLLVSAAIAYSTVGFIATIAPVVGAVALLILHKRVLKSHRKFIIRLVELL